MYYGEDLQTVENENNRRISPPENRGETELETEKDIEELLSESSQERYKKAVAFIKKTAGNLEINYLLECIFDRFSSKDNKKFEAELRIILGDQRLKNYKIISGEIE